MNWSINTGSCADREPFIFTINEKIFALVGTHDGNIVCCDLKGKISWRQKLSSMVVGYILISNRLIISESIGFVHSINPNTGDFIFTLELNQERGR